ncbi:MAG: hypothetical protein KA152_16140 [Verrucomicrobiales bacterium]|nr:hypothetical protein [Verrucomicrobiales bacterium]
MTIDFDLDQLTARGQKLLLMKSNEWKCTPSEAFARILDLAAKKAGVKAEPEQTAA